MPDKPPDEVSPGGFVEEVQRHYPTRAEVQEMLAPLVGQVERLDVSVKIGQRLSRVEGGIDLIKWLVPALIGSATLFVLAQRILPQAAVMPAPDTTTTITTLVSYLP